MRHRDRLASPRGTIDRCPSGDLADARTALHAQWDRLRSWVADVVDDDVADDPSRARRLDRRRARRAPGPGDGGARGVRPAARRHRPADARRVRRHVRRPRGRHRGDHPRSWPSRSRTTRWRRSTPARAAAFARLDELGPDDLVVQARRGPVLLSTMAVSRVVELVVHADDLARSVPARARTRWTPAPCGWWPTRCSRSSSRAAAGASRSPTPACWVRLAAGRQAVRRRRARRGAAPALHLRRRARPRAGCCRSSDAPAYVGLRARRLRRPVLVRRPRRAASRSATARRRSRGRTGRSSTCAPPRSTTTTCGRCAASGCGPSSCR